MNAHDPSEKQSIAPDLPKSLFFFSIAFFPPSISEKFQYLSFFTVKGTLMAFVKKDNKGAEDVAQTHKIRITLSSRNGKAVEKVCTDLLARAKDQKIRARGPVRLPTRTLKITTRKTPCGNGTNTWDTFEMKIYKRLIDLYAPQEDVKNITAINIEAGVDVEVTVTDV